VRRRADETQRPALQMRQQHVLLRLVEAVDFIHKQDRRLVVEPQVLPRMLRLLADVRHAALHAAERDEARLRLLGDDVRQRRLPHARRPVEDQRREAVRLHRAAQQLPLRQDVPLPGILIQRARPHARGQRRARMMHHRRRAWRLGRGRGEKVIAHSDRSAMNDAESPSRQIAVCNVP